MGTLGISRYALRLGAAAALLAGCGGSQPPIGAPSVMPQSRAIATHADRGGSWMLPEALSEDVLYISNVYTVRGTVDLGGAQTVYQWWIEGKTVVGSDDIPSTVRYWNYPAGGSAIKSITKDVFHPYGATVSLAPSR